MDDDYGYDEDIYPAEPLENGGVPEAYPEPPSLNEKQWTLLLEPAENFPDPLNERIFIFSRHLALTKVTTEEEFNDIMLNVEDILRCIKMEGVAITPEQESQIMWAFRLHLSKSKDYGNSARERVELNSTHLSSRSLQEMEGVKAPSGNRGGLRAFFGGKRR